MANSVSIDNNDDSDVSVATWANNNREHPHK